MIRKESTAWCLLAEMIDDLNQQQAGRPFPSNLFLCHALGFGNPFTYGLIGVGKTLVANVSRDTRNVMKERIQLDMTDLADDCGAYSDSDDPQDEDNEGRVLACLMFSHEAASEGR